MRTRGWIVLQSGIGLVLTAMAWLGSDRATGHWDYRGSVRFLGRLVDASSGVALAGAEVITLPWTDMDEVTLNPASRREMAHEGSWHGQFCAVAQTASDGTFEAIVCVAWAQRDRDGVAIDPPDCPPRTGVEALRIESPRGSPPIRVEVRGGRWTPTAGAGEVAVWDVGDLKVPAPTRTGR